MSGRELRTSLEIQAVVSFSNGEPLISHPQWAATEISEPKLSKEDTSKFAELHPIHKAEHWMRRLAMEPGLTKAQIAEEEGVSRPIITSLTAILGLDSRIPLYLRSLNDPAQVSFFTERRLRPLRFESPEKQWENFQKLIERSKRRLSTL